MTQAAAMYAGKTAEPSATNTCSTLVVHSRHSLHLFYLWCRHQVLSHITSIRCAM